MRLDEYQKWAMSTCMASCHNFSYMSQGLVGEVGEFAGKVAKGIRKEQLFIEGNRLKGFDVEGLGDLHNSLKAELGDILWFVAGMADVLGWTLEDVAEGNLKKLAARKEAGTIDGNGDGISGADRRV